MRSINNKYNIQDEVIGEEELKACDTEENEHIEAEGEENLKEEFDDDKHSDFDISTIIGYEVRYSLFII